MPNTPEQTPRRVIQRQLVEVIARTLHAAIPAHPMLILPASAGGDTAPWLRRINGDETFKDLVRTLASQITLVVTDNSNMDAQGVTVRVSNREVWMTLETRDGLSASFKLPDKLTSTATAKKGVIAKAIGAWCDERISDADYADEPSRILQ